MIIVVQVSARDLVEMRLNKGELADVIHQAMDSENLPVTAIDIDVEE